MDTPTALHDPPLDLAGWVAAWRDAEIPVLAHSAEALELMRANEDDVDANMLGEMIAADPLLSLKVLRVAAEARPARVVTDPETVTAAIVMMGITPFFRALGSQPTIESHFAGRPDALAGLQSVVDRSFRAARFALGFAVHRSDPDAALLHLAALLHDFAEMLLWCHGPELALQLRRAQQADRQLRSAVAQRALLHVELADLQQALMRAWRLPPILVRVTDDRHADQAPVKNVQLAVRLARHSADGWDNPALPDDYADIAGLLNLSPAAAESLVQEIDRG